MSTALALLLLPSHLDGQRGALEKSFVGWMMKRTLFRRNNRSSHIRTFRINYTLPEKKGARNLFARRVRLVEMDASCVLSRVSYVTMRLYANGAVLSRSARLWWAKAGVH